MPAADVLTRRADDEIVGLGLALLASAGSGSLEAIRHFQSSSVRRAAEFQAVEAEVLTSDR